MSYDEKHVQNEVLRRFGTRPDLRLWRQNTGAAQMPGNVPGGRRRWVQFGLPGAADLTGIVPVVQVLECPHCQQTLSTPPLGVRLEIECKAPGRKPSKDQRTYGAMIERFYGLWFCADDPDVLAQALAPYLGGTE